MNKVQKTSIQVEGNPLYKNMSVSMPKMGSILLVCVLLFTFVVLKLFVYIKDEKRKSPN